MLPWRLLSGMKSRITEAFVVHVTPYVPHQRTSARVRGAAFWVRALSTSHKQCETSLESHLSAEIQSRLFCDPKRPGFVLK